MYKFILYILLQCFLGETIGQTFCKHFICIFSYLQIRSEAAAAGTAPAKEDIWQYFVSKCANNLHLVLAMSPVGDTLRTRCRNFPGLFM